MSFSWPHKGWFAALAMCTSFGMSETTQAQCAAYAGAVGTQTYLSGTTDIGNHCDDCSNTVALPFAVTFYGSVYPAGANVNAGSNGWLDFTTAHSSGFYSNTCLPSTAGFGPAIFLFWDDQYTSNTAGGAGIFTATFGVAPNRQFVIEWRNALGSASAVVSNYEVVFTEGSSDFDLVYGPILNSAASATEGAQASGTGPSIQISCNTTAGAPVPNATYHFTCTPPSGSCCTTAGVCSLVVSAAACISPSTYNAGGSCTPNPCVGACCNTTGSCSTTTSAGCVSPSTFTTLGSTCTPNPCGGACCNTSTGSCSSSTSTLCVGATAFFNGNGSVCSPNPCTGACCNDSTAVCTLTVAANCPSGSTFSTLGSVCSPTPCPSGGCCSTISGFCAVTGPAGCSTGNPGPRTYLGTGVTCTAANCVVPAAPANDPCSFPEPAGFDFSGTSFMVTGEVKTATADGSAGSPPSPPNASPCGVGSTIGTGNSVYYTFTPSTTASFSVSVCNPSNVWDSVISVHTACPPSSANALACNDDGACAGGIGLSFINTVTLNAGTTYLIRVAAYSTSTSFGNGEFILQVTGDPIGACCKNDGTCSPFTLANCSASSGSYQGDGSSCGTVVCTGACCVTATAACSATGSAACTAGSTFQGVGTTCSPTPCPGGACCVPDTAACSFTGASGCASPSMFQGVGTACTPSNPCPGGACCVPDTAACSFTGASGCASPSMFQGLGTACSPNPCPGGACCNMASGACTFTGNAANCPGGSTFQGLGSVCDPNPCPTPPGQSCSSPIVVSLNTAVAGDLSSSVQTSTITCSSGVKGLWYSFTAPSTGVFHVDSLLVTGSGANPSLGIFQPCGTQIFCVNPCAGSDTSQDVPLNLGDVIVFRAGSCGDLQLTYSVSVTALTTGACCNASTGACTQTSNVACGAANFYQGENVACPAGNVCPTAGSCCDGASGACVLRYGPTCASGNTVNAATTCAGGTPDANCASLGSCCNTSSGGCTLTYINSCASGSTFNSGASCSGGTPDPSCPASACCDGALGICTVIFSGSCGSGTPAPGNTCSPNGCSGLPSTCENFDAASSLPAGWASSATGSGTGWAILSDQSHSAPNSVFASDLPTVGSDFLTLPPVTIGSSSLGLDFWSYYDTEATFDGWTLELSSDGGTTFVNVGDSAWTLNGYNATISVNFSSDIVGQRAFSGVFTAWTEHTAVIGGLTAGNTYILRFRMASDSSLAHVGVWLDDVCVYAQPSSGACCETATGSCTTTTAGACGAGSTFNGGSCMPNPCPPPPGVCCRGSTCNAGISTAAACTTSGVNAGAFFASSTTGCNAMGNTISPCCHANYDKMGGIQVADIFAFLNDWFAGSKFAIPGGDGAHGTLAVQNIFDFLNLWFAGGC